MVTISESSKFEWIIMVLIIVSSISLALENPLNDPDSTLVLILKILDYTTTFIFTLEVIIKVMANGFILNGSTSYVHNGWNMIDLVIVITSLLAIF
jgi:hypothetical protein